MLNSLKLTNFRRHTSLEVDFTGGIQAIRASNEGGKSSALESIAYALFGSKALRTPLTDCVTWGEDVKSLKVVLTLQSGNDIYTFSRASSGAEVLKNGAVFCTGQNEVSALAAQLLGADINTASKLFLATQNGLRGALDDGAKTLSLLIEELAGLSAFDLILDRAQERLTLGSPNLLEERLKGAESTLEAATATMPAKPNAEEHAAACAQLEAEIEAFKASTPGLIARAAQAEKDLLEASTLYLKGDALTTTVAKAQDRVNLATSTVAGHQANASKVAPDVLPMQIALANAESWDVASKAYALFHTLPYGERYDGTVEEFEAELADVRKALKESERDLIDLDQGINAAQARRLNHTNCQTCGQDVTHLASVVETNAKVDADLARLLPQKADVVEVVRVYQLKAQGLETYRGFERQLAPFAAKLGKFVTLDETKYPALVTWSGCLPTGEGPDVQYLKDSLTKAEAEVKAIDQAKTRLEMAESQLAEAQSDLAKAQAELDAFAPPTSSRILELTEARDVANMERTLAEGGVIIKRQALNALKAEHVSAYTVWSSMNARVTDAEKVIADCRADLASLSTNNALVKKLRAIRPVIATRLWNTVLASVSVMFSQMRGVSSIVTKEKNGFAVNGQAVESLSGSTLDLLGLSIRTALLRTFLPECGLLVLDEPCAAMDSERTEEMLGFIASAGFTQTLLVTHESISSSMADNLIEL